MLCSSSVPPDDDDDPDDPAIIVLICHECDRSELAQLLFLNRFLRFYRATLCVSAVLAVAWCLSVRPSVRTSVMLVHCIQTAEDIVKLLCRPGSPIVLVF